MTELKARKLRSPHGHSISGARHPFRAGNPYPRSRGYRLSCIKDQSGHIRVPELGHIKLKALKNIQIREFYDHVLGNNRQEIKKLEHVHKILNRMLNWAVENEIGIPRNPISKGLIKSIKQTANRSKREEQQELEFSFEDAVLLLREVKGKPAEIIFQLQMLHGLRIGEGLGLTWENVDLQKKHHHCQSTVTGHFDEA